MLAQDLNSLIVSLILEPLFLVDTELSGDGKGKILRVVVDTDAGVTVQQLAQLNRELGRSLEEGELIAGRYRLEVCSPGLDRALRHPRVLAKALGRKVLVRLADVAPGETAEWTGVLKAAHESGFEIDVNGEPMALAWSQVQAVHHVLEW
jgi:ribosome maturation factor RimP